jgi:hypothetical protein
MRHISVRRSSDLRRPEIRSFLRQARRHAGLIRQRSAAARVVTRVKAGGLAKRRSRPDAIDDNSLLPNRRIWTPPGGPVRGS